MKRLIALLHRHGETSLNAGNVFRSRLDPPLNEDGLRQAAEAAEWLERFDVTRIVTSPMLRAWQTAVLVQYEFPTLLVQQERALMPWNLGFIAGRDRDDYADLLEYYVKNPEKAPPDGECLLGMEDRTRRFFDSDLEAHEDALTCYVLHQSNIVTLEQLATGRPRDRIREESVKPGGVLGLYEDGTGYSFEPLFGIPEKAVQGAS